MATILTICVVVITAYSVMTFKKVKEINENIKALVESFK